MHQTLPGFEATPLTEAPKLAKELGVGHVFVKDEHIRAGLPAFKILGAAWAVFKALGGEDESRGLPGLKVGPETTLVCATAGNHGRAVAYLAKLLKIKAHIFIPAGTSPARIEAIRSEGADVQIVDGDYKLAVAKATARAEADPKALHAADVGNSMSPVWASQGYRTILQEIDEQLGGLNPDIVVVPVGAGAFASTVVRHYRSDGARPAILAVEPESAACLLKSLQTGKPVHIPGPHPSVMAGLNAGDVDEHAWPILQQGVDAAITITDDETHQAMRDLADENIVAGECGAASLAGLRKARNGLELKEDAVVVLISTEGVHDPAAYQAIVSR
ncbi:diaminopropionate ammonia-lyase [Kibdelosporangium banguiense]|uniref:Diaminopropionate ammonia-lyase n=1 Tax=Kibdelosporangium banguiense TaxID=1365924 RepID=A0ABS4TCF9_9PSEU|nr:pyridoxal-phosphate dependent enzyme [Kibdelosporangium banguiense]MBP2322112.1 diaminopropionate ammonia-lyase [Kibdelosporangium banguiense]